MNNKITPVALIVLQLLTLRPTLAATIVVNNGGDLGEACTLREAISSINTSQSSGGCLATGLFGVSDTINFNVSVIAQLQSELEITNNVIINPDGDPITIVNTSGNSRVINIEGAEVSINNATISGGNIDTNGGGINVAQSTLSLNNSTISNNNAGQNGGGINVSTDSTVTITNSTITNNSASIGDTGFYNLGGGGIYVSNNGDLSIYNSAISGNTAGGFFSRGGGIYVSGGQLSLNDSSVSNNNSIGSQATAGGIFINGARYSSFRYEIRNDRAVVVNGVVINGGIASINNSTISKNFTGTQRTGISIGDFSEVLLSGSKILDHNGTGVSVASNSELNINNSVISGNRTSDRAGGGISASTSTLLIENSEISYNSTDVSGGGVNANNSTISIVNSTLSNNTVVNYLNGASGGALNIRNSVASLINSTISSNQAIGFRTNSAGLELNGNSTVNLSNNIISGNVNRGGFNFGADFDNNGNSIINFYGVNLIGDSSKSTTNQSASGVVLPGSVINATLEGSNPANIEKILLPLADNGGLSRTHALTQNSLAVDTGNNTICEAELVNNVDQRGEKRPNGKACDLGSFESVEKNPDFFVIPMGNGKSVIFNL